MSILRTLMIHPEPPEMLREVVPGEYAIVHVRVDDPYSWGSFREHEFDFVCTVGFDFKSITNRWIIEYAMKPDAAVIHLRKP